MIIPLSFKIEPKTAPEESVLTNSGPLYVAPINNYRVSATVIDTELRRVITYQMRSLVDETKPAYSNIGEITHRSLDDGLYNRRYLERLRDALDELLGDPAGSFVDPAEHEERS